MTARPATVDKLRLEQLSLFRYQLRRFLRFSEDAARDAGITSQQYQLLLHTQGFPDREWATIGELAERLQTQHHSAATLATRCEELGLVQRRSHELDARVVEVHLTAAGRRCLDRIAAQHASEVSALAEVVARTRSEARKRRN